MEDIAEVFYVVSASWSLVDICAKLSRVDSIHKLMPGPLNAKARVNRKSGTGDGRK